jgi:ABC-type glycerol-3-phosphate transport system substrate-binding protein
MRRTRLTILLVILMFFSMSTMFYGSVNAKVKTSATVTIKFWYTENDAEKPGVLAKIATFEAANPNITVDATQHGFFGVGDEYRTAFVAGQEPDVLRTPRDDVPSFAHDGLIKPLTAEFTTADLADFLPASLKLMNYSGDLWGFPQAIDCPMFLFNKHLFDVVGLDSSKINWTTSWTWPEFSWKIGLLNQTAGVYALSLAGMFYGAQPFYYGQGGYFFEDSIYDRDHIAINSTVSRNSLVFLKNVTDSTVTPPWTEQGWSYFVGDFGQGKVAMIATGPWQILDLLSNHPQFNGTAYGNDNLGFMQVPHDAQDHYGALIGGNYYTISSQTTKYDAAVKFVKYMSSKDAMAYSAINDYHIPARFSVMTDAAVMAAPSFQYVNPYFQQAVNAIRLTPSPYYGRLESAFGDRIGNEFLAGDITLDQLINKTIHDWYAILPAPAGPALIPGYSLPVILTISLSGLLGIIVYTLKKHKLYN